MPSKRIRASAPPKNGVTQMSSCPYCSRHRRNGGKCVGESRPGSCKRYPRNPKPPTTLSVTAKDVQEAKEMVTEHTPETVVVNPKAIID